MYKLGATIFKELLLLGRDRTGLLVLFLMPAVLVMVVSLVQENVLKTEVRILFVDNDRGAIGKAIEKQLVESSSITVIKEFKGRNIDEKLANESVADGEFQFCVIIPKGASEAVKRKARKQITVSIFPKEEITGKEDKVDIGIPDLIVYFDPTVQGIFRTAVLNALNRAVFGLETELKLRLFSEIFPAKLKGEFQKAEEMFGFDITGEFDNMMQGTDFGWAEKQLLGIREKFASRYGFNKMPTSVQQNVPAWSLFGIFFIVVPIAGSLIREKENGTFLRMVTMPVSYSTLLLGKIIAYLFVGLVQFVFIILIGKIVLPLLGTPTLDMGSAPVAIFLILVSTILAATGYGIMLGTVCRTYEQASMFGPISIVIAAALGGVMVPVYAMPRVMQDISVFSPLAWGLNAFYDIFLREGNLNAVLPESAFLLIFFAINLLVAWFFMFRRGTYGTI